MVRRCLASGGRGDLGARPAEEPFGVLDEVLRFPLQEQPAFVFDEVLLAEDAAEVREGGGVGWPSGGEEIHDVLVTLACTAATGAEDEHGVGAGDGRVDGRERAAFHRRAVRLSNAARRNSSAFRRYCAALSRGSGRVGIFLGAITAGPR